MAMNDLKISVSIIIPVYNCERYLRECLDSVLRQTIEKKEIICIDDGSTDKSLEILDEYAKKYSFMVIIRQKNMGAGKARNVGILKASGEYVAFLDADDYYNEIDALEKMVNCCREKSLPICGGLRKMIDMDGGSFEEETHRETVKDKPEGVLVEYMDYQDDFHYQNYIYSREFLQTHNILFPDLRRYQDPPFFLDAMIAAKRFWVLPVELYCYRMGHPKFLLQSANVADTLRGIKCNLIKAEKYGYSKLRDRLVDRVNEKYYDYIIHNFSKPVMLELLEIDRLIQGTEFKVRALSALEQYKQIQTDNSVLCSSYYILDRFLEMKKKRSSLDGLLIEKGYKNIVIYGLGKFGRILVDELINSKVHILFAIDQKVTEYAGVKADTLEALTDNVDLIIVTPIKDGQEIMDRISSCSNVKTLRFEDIMRLWEGWQENR